MPEVFPRHTMVKPSSRAWAALMTQRPDLANEPLVAGWADACFPLVVRRALCDETPQTISLGLPLPPAQGKRRIALTLDRNDILAAEPPPLLSDAVVSAPVSWHACIDRLVRLDPSVRTFGSLAWQYLTGLPYLSAGSDLDLLWQSPTDGEIEALLEGISAIEQISPMRIDGEIDSAGGAVQWRELRNAGADSVLVKTLHGVIAVPRVDLFVGSMQ